MNPDTADKKTTIRVYRQPRRSFKPPRRAGQCNDEGETNYRNEAGSRTGENEDELRPQLQQLEPLIDKVIKKLRNEEDVEDATRVRSKGGGNPQDQQEACQTKRLLEDGGVDDGMGIEETEGISYSPSYQKKGMGGENSGNHYLQMGNQMEVLETMDDPSEMQHEENQNNEDMGINNQNQFRVPRSGGIQSQRSNFSAVEQSFCQAPISQSQPQLSSQDSQNKLYYEAVYAKASTRKHKKMESDGFIIISGSLVSLKDASGKTLESSSSYKLDSEHLEDGKIFKLGSREIQISDKLPGNPFSSDMIVPPPAPAALQRVGKLPMPLKGKPFVSPCNSETLASVTKNKDPTKPMFNPDDPEALVMPILNPSEDVLVVVDPHLSRHLREHQREGVTFLYKCVMNPYYSGAILGDEMGLGKTLQCIALLWTLLKQGPYQRKEIVKRALIVAPSSLVSNWDKEFHRWLGFERVKVFAVNSDHPLKHCPPQCPVIIMSYEMATRSEEALKKMRFDILVCDEAHKIKNRNGQSYVFLSKLACNRRVLLTGTPVQNDLMELYSLVDFANPGVLGTESEFRKEYEKPIEKYQEAQSSFYEKQEGQAKALQLNNILNNFFLRRTHNVMIRYLPPRVTFVVICRPSSLQIDLYKKVLSLSIVQDCVTGSGSCSAPLSVILALKKLCNHPSLVHPKANNSNKEEESVYASLGRFFPQGYRHNVLKIEESGKMVVLVNLLKSLEGQKVVVVSHYTQTLDLLEAMCKMFNFNFKRLDGSTMAKQRQQIVDQFNTGLNENIFLLSSKAGGLGLNLQGASNIVLYDIDWNPAHDIQAMSRCWRPGQKKITHIYRLITSGTIEERIYHRQIAKQDLSGSVMDLLLSNSAVKFSPQDLKDIFSLVTTDTCLTHDLIECPCDCDGTRLDMNNSVEQIDENDGDVENFPPPKKKLKAISTMAELNRWEHHGPPFENLEAPTLQTAAKNIHFVFCSSSISQGEDLNQSI